MTITQMLCPESKYSIKCPYAMTPQYITIHNTANDASAMSEVSYMIGNNKETSFHYAVDDYQAVQGILENRNAWHAGDGGKGTGNRKSIGIEICYSKSGGDRFVKALYNGADLAAQLLIKYGWGTDHLKKHQDWSGKYCPHRILSDYGWDYFVTLVQQYIDNYKGNTPATNYVPVTNDSVSPCEVTYQTWDDVKNKWLPNVTGNSDYAGIFGHDVCAVYANLSSGNIGYRVHQLNGGWLPAVTNRNDYAGVFNKPIDAVMFNVDNGYTIWYKAHIRGGDWLSAVNGWSFEDSENGYAGIFGKPIDAIQVWLDAISETAQPVVIESKVENPVIVSETIEQPVSVVEPVVKDDGSIVKNIYRVQGSLDGETFGSYSSLVEAISVAGQNKLNVYDVNNIEVWTYKTPEVENPVVIPDNIEQNSTNVQETIVEEIQVEDNSKISNDNSSNKSKTMELIMEFFIKIIKSIFKK